MISNMDRSESASVKKALAERLSETLQQGFTEIFRVAGDRLIGIRPGYFYTSKQVYIVNYFRIEEYTDPKESVILYLIETTDGRKGTLIDACDVYADSMISDFVNDMECGEPKPRSISQQHTNSHQVIILP